MPIINYISYNIIGLGGQSRYERIREQIKRIRRHLQLNYYDYDAIVIGAGPAGSMAAYRLAKRGYRVLIAERAKLPRYKSCSGMIIASAAQFIREVCGRDIPSSVMCRPAVNKGMYFIDCDNRELCFTQTGCNVWRDKFDAWLADMAREAGAVIAESMSVIGYVCDGEGIRADISAQGRRESISARYIIDCSGAVGRRRGGDCDCVYTYQIYNEGSIDCDDRYFYAFLQPELSGYDAWFNIKDDFIVAGVAVKAGDGATDRCKAYYAKFIDYLGSKYNLRIDKVHKIDKWVMPYIDRGYDIDCGNGRALNAGERAGFLNPMGEGVSCALSSGLQAADAIADNFDNPDAALNMYVRRVESVKAYMCRQWDLVGRMASTFSHMRLQH